MSTDLQLHPQIPLPNTTKLESLSSSSSSSSPSPSSSSSSNSDVVDNVFGTIQSRNGTSNNDGGEEECHTPTSPKNMIPKMVRCPPAPRKPTRLPSCKRKLNFFEASRKEEIEMFFKRATQLNNNDSNGCSKRRCLV